MFWSSKTFELSDIPDLSGKIAIVTGSSSGLGQVSALELARNNCTVIVAAENVERSLEVVEEIKTKTGNDKVEYIELDLGSLKSVRAFADAFTQKYDALHILMNNAGVLLDNFSATVDGLEKQFAINYFGHYYLTQLLLPVLEKSAPSRIVILSSYAHKFAYFGGIDYDRLHDKTRTYRKVHEYGKTKAQVLLFTRELSKRLNAKGINNVYVNAAFPGGVATHAAYCAVGFLSPILFTSTEQGARTQLFLATSPDVEEKKITGQYYVPTAQPGTPSEYCRSAENAANLWDYSEKLLKEKVPEYQGSIL